jgi:ribulose-phosphate 3-epimerase
MALSRKKVRIAPSILSADFARLADEVRAAEDGGADLLHVDVMDGHFVPNLTLGPAVVKALRRVTQLPIDAHLMVTDPLAFIGPFRQAGADWITFHWEASENPRATAAEIRALGAKAGMALNPDTPFTPVDGAAAAVLQELDLLLVMTVHPGFSGQAFRPDQVSKIAAAAAFRREHGLSYAIEVDGGIGPDQAPQVVAAGADILVAGSAVFGRGDAAERVRALRRAALGGSPNLGP